MGILGTVAGALSSIGATGLVTRACVTYIPQNVSKIGKGLYILGTAGLSGAAGAVAGHHVSTTVDSVVEGLRAIMSINTTLKELNEAKKEFEEEAQEVIDESSSDQVV